MACKSLSSASKDFLASVLCKNFKNSFDLFGERPFQVRVPVISFVLGSLRTFFQGNLFHNTSSDCLQKMTFKVIFSVF